jgi:hypothetical protein
MASTASITLSPFDLDKKSSQNEEYDVGASTMMHDAGRLPDERWVWAYLKDTAYDALSKATALLNWEERDNHIESHFVLLGKGGSGKSTLIALLQKSKFNKVGGVHFESSQDHLKYSVYNEIPGLGDEGVDWEEVKVKLLKIFDRITCIILCLRWDERFNDYNGVLALEFCNSLGGNVWNKSIIAVTHFDILPPSIKRKDDPNVNRKYIDAQKIKWKKVIQDELKMIRGVQDEVIKDDQICFVDLITKTGLNDLKKSLSKQSGCDSSLEQTSDKGCNGLSTQTSDNII